MKNQDESNKRESSKNAESNDSDSDIDVTSEKLNCLKVLYSKETKIPYKNAKCFDNLAKFESVIFKQISESASGEGTSKKKQSKVKETTDSLPVRRFLPHQEMVKGTGIRKRNKRNLLTDVTGKREGPLDALKSKNNEKTRVKIYTRKEHGVLGHLVGIVEAYDKHWNIALSNVQEVWKRRKLNISKTADIPLSSESTVDCISRLKRLGLDVPEIRIKSLNRKYVECTRYVPQLIVRGEQIVIIIVLDKTSNQSEMSCQTDAGTSH